eukprot:SAG31_NODE_7163_length_1769_cov_1.718563_1_plen_73_part_00
MWELSGAGKHPHPPKYDTYRYGRTLQPSTKFSTGTTPTGSNLKSYLLVLNLVTRVLEYDLLRVSGYLRVPGT